jgi:hypothetical protein
MKVTNVTALGKVGNGGWNICVGGEWFGAKFGLGQSAANDGIRWHRTTATNTNLYMDTFRDGILDVSNGFTYVTTSPVVEAQAANPITGITNASPAVFTQTNTYSENDIIRIYNTTGMKQYGGIDIQISSVTSSGYTAIGLRAATLTAGTAGFTRRISKYNAVEPEYLYVTEITKATQAVVRCSVDPTNYYVVGMKVRFSVPASFGMVEINGLTGVITALSSANYTMTVDINSTAFSTFAFPLSTLSPSSQLFATVAPAGASTQFDPTTNVYTGYNFTLQPFHTGQFTPYMYLGGGSTTAGSAPGEIDIVGKSGDKINWMAYKLES